MCSSERPVDQLIESHVSSMGQTLNGYPKHLTNIHVKAVQTYTNAGGVYLAQKYYAMRPS